MSLSLKRKIIACHECDHLYRYEPMSSSGKASCKRCGALLYRHVPNSLDRGIALYLTTFILFILANSYPFLSLELGGRIEENILLSGGLAMYQMGMGELGIIIFLTSIGFFHDLHLCLFHRIYKEHPTHVQHVHCRPQLLL